VSHLTPVVDIVTAGYHRSRERRAIKDNELIDSPDDHFIYRGFKFANPEIVLDQKDFYRRDKDVRDVETAAAVFSAPQPVTFDPSFEFAARSESLMRWLAGAPSAGRMTRSVGALARRLKPVYVRLRGKARALARRRR
jgi:hypothetical protein